MWSWSSEGSGETVRAHQMSSTAGICLGGETLLRGGGAPVSPSGSLCVLAGSTLCPPTKGQCSALGGDQQGPERDTEVDGAECSGLLQRKRPQLSEASLSVNTESRNTRLPLPCLVNNFHVQEPACVQPNLP